MEELFNTNLSKDYNLLKRFEEIHNCIYANDGLSPQQTLEEFIKILFVKFYDENQNLNLFKISISELQDIKIRNERNPFIFRIEELFLKTITEYPNLFDKDERIKLSKLTLALVVNKLQNISLADSSKDAKGLAFQKFLSHQEKEGKGQFFTPEQVIDFCVEFLKPKMGETIIDPCCGSGGFLCSSLKYIRENNPIADPKSIICSQLFGTDINKNISRIAKMKLLLESNTIANVFCENSLENLDAYRLNLIESCPTCYDGFDIVLTNPPFGTSGKILNQTILESFDLGHKWIKKDNYYIKTSTIMNGQVAEILFIERCLQLLKEGGRMGIVLPNGHFENPSLDYLREYIKSKAKILGVVNLPSETFIPYGTGVKTSLLFLQKKAIDSSNYPVFFGRINKLGYQGNKNGTPMYKKDEKGTLLTDRKGLNIVDEDYSLVLKDYECFQNGATDDFANSFVINSSNLRVRLDYDFYSPENRSIINTIGGSRSKRLAELVDIVKVKSPKLKNPSQVVEYVELSDVNSYCYEIVNSNTCNVFNLPSRASYELKKNDIVTAIAGNSVGTQKHATALVTQEYEGAICTNGFRVLRNPKINIYYLLYYLRSPFFLKQMYMYRTGAAIPNVSDSDLENILVTIPNDNVVEIISKKVEHSFILRDISRKEIDSIEEVMNISSD